MNAFQDKVIAVTGGAGGIARGIAEAILEAGGRVGLVDLAGTKLAEAAASLDPSGERVAAVEADVTDPASLDAAFGALVKRFGRFDGLVNNAGVIHMGPAE